MTRKMEHDTRHTAIKIAIVRAIRLQGKRVEFVSQRDYSDVRVGSSRFDVERIADEILEAELALC